MAPLGPSAASDPVFGRKLAQIIVNPGEDELDSFRSGSRRPALNAARLSPQAAMPCSAADAPRQHRLQPAAAGTHAVATLHAFAAAACRRGPQRQTCASAAAANWQGTMPSGLVDVQRYMDLVRTAIAGGCLALHLLPPCSPAA